MCKIDPFGVIEGTEDAINKGVSSLEDFVDNTISSAEDFLSGEMFKVDIPEVDYAKQTTALSPTYSNNIRQNSARLGGAIPEIFGTVSIYPDRLSDRVTWYHYTGKHTNYLLGIGRHDDNHPITLSALKVGMTDIAQVDNAQYKFYDGWYLQGYPENEVGLLVNGAVSDLWTAFYNPQVFVGTSGVELVRDSNNDGVYGAYDFSVYKGFELASSYLYINLVFPAGLYVIDSQTGERTGTSFLYELIVEVDRNGTVYTVRDDTGNTQVITNTAPEKDEYYSRVETYLRWWHNGKWNYVQDGDIVRFAFKRKVDNLTTGGVNRCVFGDVFFPGRANASLINREIAALAVRLPVNAEMSKATENKIMATVSRPSVGTVQSAVAYVWESAGFDSNLIDVTQLSGCVVTQVNGIIDTQESVEDTIRKIAKIGRAYPVYDDDGVLTFYVDKSRASSYTFDDSKVALGSVKKQWVLKKDTDYDGIKIRYHDPETMVERFATHPEIAVNPRNEDLWGCTDATIAQNHARYMWNSLQYRNKTYSFTTELDGNIPKVGDVVTLTNTDLGINTLVTLTSIKPSGLTVGMEAVQYDERVYQ